MLFNNPINSYIYLQKPRNSFIYAAGNIFSTKSYRDTARGEKIFSNKVDGKFIVFLSRLPVQDQQQDAVMVT